MIAGVVPARVRHRSRTLVAALLVLVAEAGHLVLALLEWPDWVVRGLFHIAAAMALGVLLASLLVGPGRTGLRRGLVLTIFLPAVWLFTRTFGFPSVVNLHRLPIGAVDAATSAVEVAVALLLVTELLRRRG